MRWLTFAVCAVGVLTLQTTLAGLLSVGPVRPDWVFVLVVFFALYCPRNEAFLAAWLLGFGVDLLSIERLGLMAITYGITAILINAVREVVFLKSAVTHFVVTLCGGLILGAMLGVYRLVAFDADEGWASVVLEGLGASVYAAAWAIPIHHVLGKFSRLLGLRVTGSPRVRPAGAGSTRV